jgi:pyruvate formate lyase activating enzyme
LIERDWYVLGHWGLDANGCCANCGTALPGHFLDQPGHFGAQRIPVNLSRYQ